MNIFQRVVDIESPDVSTPLRCNNYGTTEDLISHLSVMANIFMGNYMYKVIADLAKEHASRRNVKVDELHELDLANKLVYTCPMIHQFLAELDTASQCQNMVTTNHYQMDNRIILLSLKDLDREHIADYSLSAPKENNGVTEILLEVKFHLDPKSVEDYSFVYYGELG